MEPCLGWKRAQLVLRADGPLEARFAGPVQPEQPYRADDVFHCRRGHRRVEPACTCGFYAVDDPAALGPHVVRTVLLEVALEGRVVRHPSCVRGERQRVRMVTISGWCEFCIRPAVGVAGVKPLFDALPAPWLRGLPVCDVDRSLFALVVDGGDLGEVLGVPVEWDRESESPVAASLRRLSRARRGAAW